MTKENALDMLFEGDLYDAFGYVTAEGYEALAALDGVVLQERKTGKWIDGHSTCSICKWYPTNRYGFVVRADYNYCPNCGAKMEVGE